MASERFLKSIRLRKRSEFLSVQHQGQKYRTKNLVVLYLERPEQTLRVGIVVSKKVGGSVVRNKVKRWLREALRRSQRPELSGDMVFIAKSSITQADLPSIQEEISSAFGRWG
jgi:ribonuclease P protein component